MRKLLSLIIILTPSFAFSDSGKLVADVGFFSINAKASGESSSIANPSAFRIGYLKPLTRKIEANFSYSVLLADFSGSDMGYGLDVGANWFPLSGSSDDEYRDEQIEVNIKEIWRPYVGLNFHQRNFQSVKNSYAGFGAASGVERYFNEKMNLRAEGRFIKLSGSGESEATELGLFFGVVFKL